jgi:hypothetical protein
MHYAVAGGGWRPRGARRTRHRAAGARVESELSVCTISCGVWLATHVKNRSRSSIVVVGLVKLSVSTPTSPGNSWSNRRCQRIHRPHTQIQVTATRLPGSSTPSPAKKRRSSNFSLIGKPMLLSNYHPRALHRLRLRLSERSLHADGC